MARERQEKVTEGGRKELHGKEEKGKEKLRGEIHGGTGEELQPRKGETSGWGISPFVNKARCWGCGLGPWDLV